MRTKTKTFDCVEMKRQGAERVRRLIGGLTPAEELAFWARGTKELKARQQAARKKHDEKRVVKGNPGRRD